MAGITLHTPDPHRTCRYVFDNHCRKIITRVEKSSLDCLVNPLPRSFTLLSLCLPSPPTLSLSLCVYGCVYTCVRVCLSICLSVCDCVHVLAHKYVCVCICPSSRVFPCLCPCVHELTLSTMRSYKPTRRHPDLSQHVDELSITLSCGLAISHCNRVIHWFMGGNCP